MLNYQRVYIYIHILRKCQALDISPSHNWRPKKTAFDQAAQPVPSEKRSEKRRSAESAPGKTGELGQDRLEVRWEAVMFL